MNDPMSTSRPASEHTCTYLRHKGMYVMSVPDPDEHRFYDAYDGTVYWCALTQKSLGPDNQPVHADACQQGRGCCEH